MKSLFLVVLFSLVSFSSFSQDTAVRSEDKFKIECCAKCAGPNAVVNPALNGKCDHLGNGGWQIVTIKAKNCIHQTIPNHPKCAGK
jgi:hypothetical protein